MTSLSRWRIRPEERRALCRFLEELALGKVNKGRRISESRQCKYLDILRPPLEFFRKPATRLATGDIERFETVLASGTLLSRKGTPYRPSTRVDMRRALKTYLRWRLGPETATRLTDWLDTRDVFKTPDFLRHEEVEKLLKACRSPRERFLVAVLFDSGARATEFHNIRRADLELPEGETTYVRLTLREEFSKTKGRTISLYWKHTTEAVRDFLQQREREGIHAQDPVFTTRYPAARKFLQRLGQRVLARSIHYHLFRHSSATYYADKMNRQQLCIRYGWAFSSRMPDVYIARSGVELETLDERFKSAEVDGLRSSLARVEQDNHIKAERILQLEQSITAMQQHFSRIQEVLAANPTIQDIERALRRKRAGPSSAAEDVPAHHSS
jgi:integrase